VRKMKKTVIIVVVVALGLSLGAVVAFSYGPGFGPFGPAGRPGFGPPGFAGGVGPWGSATGLTPEQSNKLQAIREETLKEVIPLREDLFRKAGELRLLMASKNPDTAKISALQNDVLAIQGRLQETGEKFRAEAQNVVPELQERIAANGPDAGFGPGRGFGPGPGFGPGRPPMGRPWW
jgi:Spy/CpxP family protein refolding chaperone